MVAEECSPKVALELNLSIPWQVTDCLGGVVITFVYIYAYSFMMRVRKSLYIYIHLCVCLWRALFVSRQMITKIYINKDLSIPIFD